VNKISVMIVDDHPIIREGLKLVIGDQLDLEIAGEAAPSFMAPCRKPPLSSFRRTAGKFISTRYCRPEASVTFSRRPPSPRCLRRSALCGAAITPSVPESIPKSSTPRAVAELFSPFSP
jgi:hypothetical protein